MSIFIMDGKTFQKVFVKKEDPDKVLKARYILVSSRIRIMEDSGFDNVQKANSILFPGKQILSDPKTDDFDHFARIYERQLQNAKTFLSNLVFNAVQKNKTFIFLCSETEWEIGYLQCIATFIERQFHYPVYNYLKYKKGKEKIRQFDKNLVLHKCKKQQEKEKNRELHLAIKSKKDQKQMLKKLSGKEMKRILQNIDAYMDGMTKKQMKWMIKHYLFDA